MLTTLLRTGVLALLLNDYLKRNYPNKYEEMIVSISYNLIYLYSKAQILYANLIKVLNKKIEENPNLLKLKNDFDLLMKPKSGIVTMIEYVKNGNSVDIISDKSDDNCDFMIYSWLDDTKSCVNKKLIYDLKEPLSFSEVSDIKFLLVELKIGENSSHKIVLKTDEYNFYIVGNTFTKQFFIYYLKQILKIGEEIKDDDKFNLKIIDHDVNTVELDFTDKNESILLEKSGYKLLNLNDSDDNK
jgi:hypothetical protein